MPHFPGVADMSVTCDYLDFADFRLQMVGACVGAFDCDEPLVVDPAYDDATFWWLPETDRRWIIEANAGLLLALVVYRIGAHIPVPGIDPVALQQLFQGQSGGILNLFNMFSGGALSRFTVFALGIMPYISASIIMQLMTHVVPTLEALKKEGEAGRRKITQYTRYGTLFLAIFQSLGIALALEGSQGLVLSPGFGFRMTAVVSLVAGTMFLMWLGEQITERGLGNGISILIFAGIVAGLPSAIGGLFELVRTGAMSIVACLFILALVVFVTYAVVFVERGQRISGGPFCADNWLCRLVERRQLQPAKVGCHDVGPPGVHDAADGFILHPQLWWTVNRASDCTVPMADEQLHWCATDDNHGLPLIFDKPRIDMPGLLHDNRSRGGSVASG